jgi:uncharacterized protein (DUF2249 family)
MISTKNANNIDVNGATVPFFEYNENGIKYYYFDSSQTPPPEPMVNAMAGLQLLKSGEKLVMINHKSPAGLFPKISGEFDFEEDTLDDGRAMVVFSKKSNATSNTDFTQNSCSGGKCSH